MILRTRVMKAAKTVKRISPRRRRRRRKKRNWRRRWKRVEIKLKDYSRRERGDCLKLEIIKYSN